MSTDDGSSPIGVVIGDSIAEGHPGAHGRLHADWNGAVDLDLENVPGQMSFYFENAAKIRVYNQGIGSQTAGQIRGRWNRDVLALESAEKMPSRTLLHPPVFAVLVCGINDVFAGRSAKEIETDIGWMIGSAAAEGIRSVVFTIGPDETMDDRKLSVVKEVNAWLADKRNITPSLRLFDFYAFANDPARDGFPAAGVFADNVHPTKESYRKIARRILDDGMIPLK